MSDRLSACVRCSGRLPFRLDPRGRSALYCSGACRAAASRERAEAASQRALQEAHEAAARLPAIEDVERYIDALTGRIERGEMVDGDSRNYARVVVAARRAVDAQSRARGDEPTPAGRTRELLPEPAPVPLSRQQRRAAERAAKSNG